MRENSYLCRRKAASRHNCSSKLGKFCSRFAFALQRIVYTLNRKMRITDILNYKFKKMNIMEENKKKHYVTPSMKVYEIVPTQILAGSTKVSVSSWGDGESLGSGEMDEE